MISTLNSLNVLMIFQILIPIKIYLCRLISRTTQDFENYHKIINYTSGNCFSVLHSNIRSFNTNFDNFTHMLSELNRNFSIIGSQRLREASHIEFYYEKRHCDVWDGGLE